MIPQDILELDFVCHDALTRFPDSLSCIGSYRHFFFFPRWYLQTVVLVYYIITVSSLILISLAYFQVLVIFDGSSFVPIQSHVTVSYIFSIPGLWIAESYIWNKEDERPYLLTSHTAQHLWIQNAYCSEI